MIAKDNRTYSQGIFHVRNQSDMTSNSNKESLNKYLGVSLADQRIQTTKKRLSLFAKNKVSKIQTIFAHKPQKDENPHKKIWKIWKSQPNQNVQKLQNKTLHRKKIMGQIYRHNLQKNYWKQKYEKNKKRQSILLLPYWSNFAKQNSQKNKVVNKKMKYQYILEKLPIR